MENRYMRCPQCHETVQRRAMRWPIPRQHRCPHDEICQLGMSEKNQAEAAKSRPHPGVFGGALPCDGCRRARLGEQAAR